MKTKLFFLLLLSNFYSSILPSQTPEGDPDWNVWDWYRNRPQEPKKPSTLHSVDPNIQNLTPNAKESATDATTPSIPSSTTSDQSEKPVVDQKELPAPEPKALQAQTQDDSTQTPPPAANNSSSTQTTKEIKPKPQHKSIKPQQPPTKDLAPKPAEKNKQEESSFFFSKPVLFVCAGLVIYIIKTWYDQSQDQDEPKTTRKRKFHN